MASVAPSPTVTLLKDGAGAVTAIAAVIREETVGWNEERELRQQVRELTAALATSQLAKESGGAPT